MCIICLKLSLFKNVLLLIILLKCLRRITLIRITTLHLILHIHAFRYHSAIHALDVIQACNVILSHCEMEKFTDIEILAFFFAAAVKLTFLLHLPNRSTMLTTQGETTHF